MAISLATSVFISPRVRLDQFFGVLVVHVGEFVVAGPQAFSRLPRPSARPRTLMKRSPVPSPPPGGCPWRACSRDRIVEPDPPLVLFRDRPCRPPPRSVPTKRAMAWPKLSRRLPGAGPVLLGLPDRGLPRIRGDGEGHCFQILARAVGLEQHRCGGTLLHGRSGRRLKRIPQLLLPASARRRNAST